MKIVVCVKRVPATDTRIKIGADGKSIDTAQVEWIISPYDEFAVECALRLKDADASTQVTVLSLGPPETTKELRTCLAMGADDAILLKDPLAGTRDATTTAKLLADAVSPLAPDLVLLGKQAVDRDQGQVGLLLASRLGLPCVTEIKAFGLADGQAKVERAGEEGTTESYQVALPAVLTCTKGLNEPRYANLKGIMAAKKKPIDERDVQPGDDGLVTRALELPPGRNAGKIVGEGADAVPELVRLLQQEAKVL
ncbi:MAG: electron transfer flavoprotein subunit beta/FixA family protein [Planctomycetes bacterium]|nr:electron transfer flavoprotein subunit beta/FixA family protein [Planctomycetota bacterium]